MNIVIIGLTITSSWGNGHATTYRGLVRELRHRGHHVLFLEHDKPWYAANRDLAPAARDQVALYQDFYDLQTRFETPIRAANLVIVGSYVPLGIDIGRWVTAIAEGITAFYDIDTPVTLAQLERGECPYLTRELIGRYDLYLSFSGGPLLDRLERHFGARRAVPLYCSVDPAGYFPEPQPLRWELGYLGTYSDDRQPSLQRLLLDVAEARPDRRFVVAGPQYPAGICWPANVERIEHLPPDEHRKFYNAQRFTLNITRSDMIKAGYSPSVRLFEAAACGTAIISDPWDGLDSILIPGEEIFVAHTTQDVLRILDQTSEPVRRASAAAARRQILLKHTAAHRAQALEEYVLELSASATAGGV